LIENNEPKGTGTLKPKMNLINLNESDEEESEMHKSAVEMFESKLKLDESQANKV
jgi:hypothetical protein